MAGSGCGDDMKVRNAQRGKRQGVGFGKPNVAREKVSAEDCGCRRGPGDHAGRLGRSDIHGHRRKGSSSVRHLHRLGIRIHAGARYKLVLKTPSAGLGSGTGPRHAAHAGTTQCTHGGRRCASCACTTRTTPALPRAPSAQSMPSVKGSTRGSCSVASFLPVQRQEVHMTRPVPAQLAQSSPAPLAPRPTQLPQVRYPVPSQ